MPGKTPLGLAKRIMARKEDDVCAQCDPDCMCSEREARHVAAALIEKMTPVEPIANNDWRLSCCCGSCKGTLYSNGGGRPKFCAKCGVPITWE